MRILPDQWLIFLWINLLGRVQLAKGSMWLIDSGCVVTCDTARAKQENGSAWWMQLFNRFKLHCTVMRQEGGAELHGAHCACGSSAGEMVAVLLTTREKACLEVLSVSSTPAGNVAGCWNEGGYSRKGVDQDEEEEAVNEGLGGGADKYCAADG